MVTASTFTIELQPNFPAEITPRDKCSHSPELALVLNTKIVRAKRGSKIEIEARICLGCGSSHDYSDECADWFSVATKFWKEFGWHREIGGRLMQFAAAVTSSDAERFYALQYGIAPSSASECLARVSA